MTEAQIRAGIVKWAKWGAHNEPSIHYRQVRPMPLLGKLPLVTDCSGFATLCFKLAGALDPNGLGFNGQGYTGTMLRHLKRIKQGEALAGDLIVFGNWPGHHVVILLESGKLFDPLVLSHGQERGPIILRLSEEAKFQPKPLNFLRATFPAPAPPHKPAPNPVSDVLNSSEVATARRIAQSGGGGGQNRMV